MLPWAPRGFGGVLVRSPADVGLVFSKTNTICKKCAQNVKQFGTVSGAAGARSSGRARGVGKVVVFLKERALEQNLRG